MFRLYLKTVFIAAMMLVGASLAFGQAKKPANVSPAAFREVTIVTEPGTIVWIDGVRFGRTGKDGRLEIKTIAAGAHTLRLRADGFKDKTQPMTAAQKGEISIPLVKTTDEAELAYQEAERLSSEDREKATAAYRRAIAVRPNYPDAYIGLARVLMESDDLEEAEKTITALRRLLPAHAEASAIEGRIKKEGGEEAKAITAFKRSITESKGYQPEAHTGLGLLYKEKAESMAGAGDYDAETANYDEAAKYLKVAIKQLSGAPDTIVIYQFLGLVYERQKKYAEAIATYEEFLRIFPNTPEATSVRSFIVQLKKAQDNQE